MSKTKKLIEIDIPIDPFSNKMYKYDHCICGEYRFISITADIKNDPTVELPNGRKKNYKESEVDDIIYFDNTVICIIICTNCLRIQNICPKKIKKIIESPEAYKRLS